MNEINCRNQSVGCRYSDTSWHRTSRANCQAGWWDDSRLTRPIATRQEITIARGTPSRCLRRELRWTITSRPRIPRRAYPRLSRTATAAGCRCNRPASITQRDPVCGKSSFFSQFDLFFSLFPLPLFSFFSLSFSLKERAFYRAFREPSNTVAHTWIYPDRLESPSAEEVTTLYLERPIK